jgi:hypothetical protein
LIARTSLSRGQEVCVWDGMYFVASAFEWIWRWKGALQARWEIIWNQTKRA